MAACSGSTDGPDVIPIIRTAEFADTIAWADNIRIGTGVSTNGTEVPEGGHWVTQEVMDDFETAINAAKIIFYAKKSQKAINDGNNSLNAAIEDFFNLRQQGSNTSKSYSVNKDNFYTIVAGIKNKPGEYFLTLMEDLNNNLGIQLEDSGVTINLKGDGHNITWRNAEFNPSALFHVGAGTIVLENIKIGRGTGNTQDRALIQMDGGKVVIKTGVTLNNNDSETRFYDGISLNGGELLMEGGLIEKCQTGISLSVSGASFKMTGGEISNNRNNGIALWSGSNNCTITIDGGIIKNNGDSGIFVSSNGVEVIIKGTTVVSGNGDWGIDIDGGANNQFTKELTSIVYGNFANGDSNESGAIGISFSIWQNSLYRLTTAGSGVALSAKTNSAGSGIANSTGDWN